MDSGIGPTVNSLVVVVVEEGSSGQILEEAGDVVVSGMGPTE